jgi:DNA mismatch repair protein PMS2
VDSIEVSDNGIGIDPSNYAGVGLKHHTSKLARFTDLKSVNSFGFRGEALNALCELSGNFTVITRTVNETVAASLSFSRYGDLKEITQVSKGYGTTVIVQNLFEVLPVRRGELIRHVAIPFVIEKYLLQ